MPLELDASDLGFLAEITSAAVEASRVYPGQRTVSYRNKPGVRATRSALH